MTARGVACITKMSALSERRLPDIIANGPPLEIFCRPAWSLVKAPSTAYEMFVESSTIITQSPVDVGPNSVPHERPADSCRPMRN
jgi:hypothetical protein